MCQSNTPSINYIYIYIFRTLCITSVLESSEEKTQDIGIDEKQNRNNSIRRRQC